MKPFLCALQIFHTREKAGLVLHPTSVFADAPELLHSDSKSGKDPGEEEAHQPQENLNSRGLKRDLGYLRESGASFRLSGFPGIPWRFPGLEIMVPA